MPGPFKRFSNVIRAIGGAEVVAAQAPKMLEMTVDPGVLGPDARQQIGTLPRRTGSEAGSLDPNRLFNSNLLYGDRTMPGLLWQIRVTDDVVQPAADGRRELLQSLEYDIVPPDRFKDTFEGKIAAARVGAVLNGMPDRKLAFWVAETYDYWSTIGHANYEMVWDGSLRMNYLRRGLIERWDQDETGYRWARCVIKNRSGIGFVEAEKCAYFARFPLPGQYDGTSAYRCLVAPSTTTYELYANLLQAMRWARGFMHIQAGGGGDDGVGEPTKLDHANIQEFTDELINGDGDPEGLLTTMAVKVNILSSQVPALQSFAPLAQFQAESKNRAAMNALNNLGMRGSGARSLGEVVEEKDQAHLRAHLDAFLDIISGDNHANGTMMRTLTELVGCDPMLAPRIRVRWTDSAKKMTVAHIGEIRELIKERILTPTTEMSEFIARQVGLPEDVVTSQKDRNAPTQE